MIDVIIKTEWIKLDALLKFSGAVGTGGEAKALVQQGEVLVNGKECRVRGLKLKAGDIVTLDSNDYKVVKG